jgi:tetratricopeptide (TPR) repeat protein
MNIKTSGGEPGQRGCRVANFLCSKASVPIKKAFLLVLLLPMSAGLLRAQTIPGLGSATFPTSTRSAAAQSAFLRGLLLLHLFEYSDAAKSFVAAENADSGFAMAYWGEAMTFNHPVWNQVNVRAGHAALAKFGATAEERGGRIADPRERAYMSAVEILFSGKGDKRERDAQYAAAMKQVAEAYPKDDEAQLFYALALLGASEGVRDVPTYLEAAEIAKSVFARDAQNPGAAHYWIHGMDDPEHAAGALVAARALSKIAPDAGHAQHMCSHIFMALGMWDDVVDANIAATSVVNRQAAAEGKQSRHCGHYSYWLEYGYLEQGRIGEAEKVLADCRDEAAESGMAARARGTVDPDDSRVGSFVQMRSRYIVDTGRLNSEVVGWNVELGGAQMPQFNYAFGSGFAAAELGDVGTARECLASLDQLLTQLPALFDHAGLPADDPARRVPQIQRLQMEAAILSAEGQGEQAIARVQRAIASGKYLPYAFGPPSPEKPSEELLGELLWKANKGSQAREAFAASLQRAPRRTESLLGLARAESAMGDKAAAAKSYGELLQIWRNADPGYAPREEAQRSVSVASQAAN